MNSKEAYKQKIEAELKQVQAKLAEFEAGAKSLTTDARIKYARQIDNLKQKVNTTKAQLKELSERLTSAYPGATQNRCGGYVEHITINV